MDSTMMVGTIWFNKHNRAPNDCSVTVPAQSTDLYVDATEDGTFLGYRLSTANGDQYVRFPLYRIDDRTPFLGADAGRPTGFESVRFRDGISLTDSNKLYVSSIILMGLSDRRAEALFGLTGDCSVLISEHGIRRLPDGFRSGEEPARA